MSSGSGGISGWMYVLRGTAERAERDPYPDLSRMFPPGTIRQARRRLVSVWALCLSWLPGFVVPPLLIVGLFLAPVGVLIALATQWEPAWIGSPIRRWTLWAVPVAFVGFVIAVVGYGVE